MVRALLSWPRCCFPAAVGRVGPWWRSTSRCPGAMSPARIARRSRSPASRRPWAPPSGVRAARPARPWPTPRRRAHPRGDPRNVQQNCQQSVAADRGLL